MNPAGRILSAIDKDPIILSHHPLCGKFDEHMFEIRGRKVCIGCTTVYPSAALTIIVLLVTDLNTYNIAFPLAVGSFALNLARFLASSHRLSLLFNGLLGVSLGSLILAAIDALGRAQLLIVLIGLAVGVTFSLLKGHRVLATCKRCDRYAEFPSCYRPKTAGTTASILPEAPEGRLRPED